MWMCGFGGRPSSLKVLHLCIALSPSVVLLPKKVKFLEIEKQRRKRMEAAPPKATTTTTTVSAEAAGESLWADSFVANAGGSPAWGLRKLKREMMAAFTELFAVGLTIGARFLAEQATGIDEDAELAADDSRGKEKHNNGEKEMMEEDEIMKTLERGNTLRRDHVGDENEECVLQLAKAYFNLKEYKRCARALEKCSSRQATFLRFFSLYLAGSLPPATHSCALPL